MPLKSGLAGFSGQSSEAALATSDMRQSLRGILVPGNSSSGRIFGATAAELPCAAVPSVDHRSNSLMTPATTQHDSRNLTGDHLDMLNSLKRLWTSLRQRWCGRAVANWSPHSSQLGHFVENVRDYAIFLLDKQGFILTWNVGAERIKGYSAAEIIGQHFSRFYPQEAIDSGWPEHELEVAAQTGRFEDEGWRLRKDGSRFWANVIITADRSGTGDLQGFIKITRDLTDRKLAEDNARQLLQQQAETAALSQHAALLHQQREQLQVTLTSIGDAVIVTDMEGRVTFMNPIAIHLTGWDISAAAGQPVDQVFRIVNETTRKVVESPVHRVLQDGVIVGLANHTILLSRDGREIPIDDSGAPVRGANGELCGVVLVFRDITESRQALDARMQLAAIVDSSDDAIIGEDLEGRITSWNHGAELLYGYKPAEIIGQPLSRLVPPDQTDELPGILQKIRRGERVAHFETYRIRKDGHRIAVSLTISPIRNAENEIVGASKIARDITDRLEESRRKNEFLALLAHELRNPLTPLHNGLQLLKMQQMNAEMLEPIHQMMARQVHHLTRLVEDLLDLNRISTGKMRLHLELLSLADIIQTALEACQHAIEDHQHQLSLTLPTETLIVRGDRTRLVQILVNVLTNAARYTDPGGRISLIIQRTPENAVLRIQDNGIGIPAEMLGRVFELFTQVEHAGDKSRSGLGVGLHIVKRLVELHGGQIDAHSAGAGQGSEFVIRIPLATLPTVAPAPAEPTKLSITAHPRRILIVDDNIDAAESLAQLLRALGHEVQTGHDGQEGLTAARKFCPHLILLDLGMPKLNGYETCRRIREHSWGITPVIHALSGWDQKEDRERSAAAGFNGHLAKPVQLPVLQKILDELPVHSEH